MLRGFLAASAAVLACTPASATVLFQESGIGGIGISTYLLLSAGKYRLTFDAPGFDPAINPGEDDPSARRLTIWVSERPLWILYDKGVPYYFDESESDFALPVTVSGSSFSAIYEVQDFVDSRDATGTGSTHEYFWTRADGQRFGSFLNADFVNAPAWTFTVSTVPEPATWALLLAGFGMIGSASRRRWRLNHVGDVGCRALAGVAA